MKCLKAMAQTHHPRYLKTVCAIAACCLVSACSSTFDPAVKAGHEEAKDRSAVAQTHLRQPQNTVPMLARHGLQEQDLFDPCVNVLVAAWILSNNFARLGYNTQGLGAYNAATPWKRERYARQILQTFKY